MNPLWVNLFISNQKKFTKLKTFLTLQFFIMKNILITGGTGFIGSHTCISLLEEGYDITIIDSLINSSKKVLEGLPVKIIF